MYRLSAKYCSRHPEKYYHKVICHCWNNKGEPQVLLMDEKELAEHEKEFGRVERYNERLE